MLPNLFQGESSSETNQPRTVPRAIPQFQMSSSCLADHSEGSSGQEPSTMKGGGQAWSLESQGRWRDRGLAQGGHRNMGAGREDSSCLREGPGSLR